MEEIKVEINFDGHILALLSIKDGKVAVEACINGYGDAVPIDNISIKPINPLS